MIVLREGTFSMAIVFTLLFSPPYAWYFLWLVPFFCFFPRPSVFQPSLSATWLYRAGWPPSVLGTSIQYLPFAFLFTVESLRLTHPKETPDERAVA
jgi:alpha-1,6-mannosyltransferase